MTELPPGWARTAVGEVSASVRGVTYKKEQARTQAAEEYVPLLRATNISGGLVLDDDLIFVPSHVVRLEQYVRLGDVVVASSSGSSSVVGKSAELRREWKGTFGAFCMVLRPSQSLEPSYLAHYVGSPTVRQRWSALAAGTNINNLKREHIATTTLPLPPLNEQRRIVAAIEEQLSRLDAAEATLAAAYQRLARMQRAVRVATMDRDWPTLPLGEVTVNHDGRRVPIKAGDRARRRGQFPYYGASGVIDTIDEFLFEGDYLLIAEDGANLITRNKPIAFRASGRFWVNNHAHVVQTTERVDQRFLESFLNGADLAGLITGTAQPKLTQANLNKIRVPVPPLNDQQQIVARVEERLSAIDGLRAGIVRAQRRSASLRRAVLERAFRGELVPQDPSDEPASVLLERVRAERAAEPKSSPRRRVTA